MRYIKKLAYTAHYLQKTKLPIWCSADFSLILQNMLKHDLRLPFIAKQCIGVQEEEHDARA